ncbi:MAG: hypothetical protein QOI66_2198, partial [Myxococcales bacterium]|nr:hypothetical protein [Myxococcales bacterium]
IAEMNPIAFTCVNSLWFGIFVARSFWVANGFREYAVTMERTPDEESSTSGMSNGGARYFEQTIRVYGLSARQ